jgi:hypothetical protein
MATLTALAQFDVNQIDLNFYSRYFYEDEFRDNAQIVFGGVTYQDVYGINGYDGFNDLVLAFLGSNFSLNSEGVVASGTVTAMAESEFDSDEILWAAQGFSLSAAALYNAALTASNADEFELVQAAFNGNDTIYLSPFADRMNGFAGDDQLTGGGGNDVLDGGQGIDTAVFSGPRSNATVSFQGATVFVTMAGEGTDTLTNFEFVRFGSESFSIASLAAPATTQVFLGSGSSVPGFDHAAYYGSNGNERISFSGSVAGATIDQNIEAISFSSPASSYFFQQRGNVLDVFAGTSRVTSIVIQDDADGSQLIFSGVSTAAKLVSGVLQIGGTAVPSAAPGMITLPSTATASASEALSTLMADGRDSGGALIEKGPYFLAGTAPAEGLAGHGAGHSVFSFG